MDFFVDLFWDAEVFMFQVEKLDEIATMYCCSLSRVVFRKKPSKISSKSKVKRSAANFLSQFHASQSCVPLNMQIPKSADEIDMEINDIADISAVD